MLRIGLAQLASRGSKDDGLRAALKATGELESSDLVVLPEYLMGIRSEEAEPLDGHVVRELGRVARSSNVAVVANIAERGEGGTYNSTLAISPKGEVVAVHRKTLLFDALGQRESNVFMEGELELTLLKVAGFTAGLATCFELRFPELFRAMALAGANLFLVSAAWYKGAMKEEQWSLMVKARAHENTSYLVGVGNAADQFVGRSVVVGPWGNTELELGHEERTVIWKLREEEVERARSSLPLLDMAKRRLPQPRMRVERARLL